MSGAWRKPRRLAPHPPPAGFLTGPVVLSVTLCPIAANQSKLLDSDAMRSCIVSYLDTEGIRHSVEVHADSLYEAVVLAVHTFRQHDCDPCEISKLEVEIRTSVTHEITLKKVSQWLNSGARSPKEAVTKERLREML